MRTEFYREELCSLAICLDGSLRRAKRNGGRAKLRGLSAKWTWRGVKAPSQQGRDGELRTGFQSFMVGESTGTSTGDSSLSG
jgi:hypothetical protein